jgi:hypothetical protein
MSKRLHRLVYLDLQHELRKLAARSDFLSTLEQETEASLRRQPERQPWISAESREGGSNLPLNRGYSLTMIATRTGLCSLCQGRIIRNRSRIERTRQGWMHEQCAETARRMPRQQPSYPRVEKGCPVDSNHPCGS